MLKPHPTIVNFQAQSKTWQEFGTWSGRNSSYQGLVKAKNAGSLKDLASLITGNSDDWKLLGKADEDVIKGTNVNIAPLLVKAEENLRSTIIKLTGEFKSTFPSTGAEITSALGSNQAGSVGGVTIGAFEETEEINKYFGGQPYKFCDCNLAIRIIYSKACLDTVGKDIFKAVCAALPKNAPKGSLTFSLFGFGSVPVDQYRVSSIKSVKNGDWIQFENYEDYLEKMRNLYIEKMRKQGVSITSVPAEGEGAWQQENALKVGENQFWGFPLGVQTEQKWLSDLQESYNKPNEVVEGKQRTDRVPGFRGGVTFINVVEVMLASFRYRAFEKTYCIQ